MSLQFLSFFNAMRLEISEINNQTVNNGHNPDGLDLEIILQSTHIISQEKGFENILYKLKNIILDYSGADRVILFEKDSNRWVPLGEEYYFPQALIEETARTKYVSILYNIPTHIWYDREEYFRLHKISSVAVLPILREGEVISILYMESIHSKDLFTPAKLSIINIISTNTGIALENSNMILKMEKMVRDRTEELNLARELLLKSQVDLSRLNELIKQINNLSDIQEVLNILINYTEKRFGLKYYILGEHIEEIQQTKIKYCKFPENISNNFIEEILNLKIEYQKNSIVSKAFIYRKILFISNVSQHSLSEIEKKIIQTSGFKSILVVPFVYKKRTIASVVFASDETINITEKEISHLSVLSENLGILYRNIINMNQLKEEKKLSDVERKRALRAEVKIKSLQKMVSYISQSGSHLELLNKMRKLFSEKYGIHSYVIYVKEEETGYLNSYWFTYQNKFENLEEVKKIHIPLGMKNSIHELVIEKKKPIFIKNVSQGESEEENKLIELLGVTSVYIIPLMMNEEVFGTLSIIDNKNDTKALVNLNFRDRGEIEQFATLLSPSIYQSIQRKKIEKTLENLKSSQNQLVQSEKMAALGNLISGVAHEINTPIGAIKASTENLLASLGEMMMDAPDVIRSMDAGTLQLMKTIVMDSGNSDFSTKEERSIRKQYRSTLESMGMENVESLTDYLLDLKIYPLREELYPLLRSPDANQKLKVIAGLSGLKLKSKIILTAVEKTAKIVYALKSYTTKNTTGRMSPANLIDGLEAILIIYQNYLKQGINVVKEFEDIPDVECFIDEINQVWTNLIFNAIQAMKNKGTLILRVKKHISSVSIEIQDSGSGIPQDVLPKIFDPFFTTKKAGEGSGLGLHICKKIIQNHDGSILVESEPGKTIFQISLPIVQGKNKDSSQK